MADSCEVRCLDCKPEQVWRFPDEAAATRFCARHSSLQRHTLTVQPLPVPESPGWDALLGLGDAGDTQGLRL